MPYVPLHNHSHYSFLDSACRPGELVAAAKADGMSGVGLTDINSVSGAIEFFRACQKAEIRPVLGSELTLEGGFSLTLIATSDDGYSNLCELLTRQTKNASPTPVSRLDRFSGSLIALSGTRSGEIPTLIQTTREVLVEKRATELAALFPGRFYIELFANEPGDPALAHKLADLADRLDLPVVATPNTRYLDPDDYQKYKVLTSVRTLTLLDEEHPEKVSRPGYHFRSTREMRDLFVWRPDAITNSFLIAKKCDIPVLRNAVGI